MMMEKILCNAKTGKIEHVLIQDSTPVYVDCAAEIADCKQRLAETDYVVIKIAEGITAKEDYDAVLAERAALRARIGELEQLQKEQMT